MAAAGFATPPSAATHLVSGTHSADGRAGLLRNAGALALGGLVARALGWIRLVLIAHVFEASTEVDAYFAAFRIPDGLMQLATGGLLASVVVPLIARETAERHGAWGLVRSVSVLFIGLFIAMALAALVAADGLAELVAPGFSVEQQAAVADLTRLMLVAPMCFAVGAAATAVLHSESRFVVVAAAPVVYNLVGIGSILILGPLIGISSAALGVSLGAISMLLVYAVALRRHPVVRDTTPVQLANRQAGRSLLMLVPRAVSLAGAQLLLFVHTALASSLGSGAVTAYALAFIILQVPITIVGVPAGTVMLPALSRAAAAGDRQRLRSQLADSMRMLTWVALYLSVIGFLMAEEIAHLLFGGGLEASVTGAIAVVAGILMLGLVANATNQVLSRAFYAMHDTLVPMFIALVQVAIGIALAWLLLDALGIAALGVGAVAGAVVRTGLYLFLLARLHRVDILAEAAGGGLRHVLAALAAGAAVWTTRLMIGPHADASGLMLVLLLCVVAAVGAVAYVGSGAALGVRESRLLISRLARLGRSSP